jgi:poly(hydroxyalkanoate) granule-associated protein
MAKKLRALSKSDDEQLAEVVRASAQQIWQAGLGAFAKAQGKGGRVFAELVKEGNDLQKRTQRLADGKVAGATGTVSKAADNVSRQAAGSWDKLEQVFEDRVSRSLKSLGVPTQKDIQALTKRVEELHKAVSALNGTKGLSSRSVKAPSKAAAKTATKAPSPKKTAARVATPRKTSAPKKAIPKKAGARTTPAE